jgi:hypothetical protein
MTDYKLGKLYEAMRSSLKLREDRLALPIVRGRAHREACKAIDIMTMGIDQRQAEMLDWAQENGYPHWTTVLRFAPVGAEDYGH